MARKSIALFILALSISCASITLADTFRLSSGGEIQGQLLNADEQPRRSYRIRLAAGGDVTLDARDVKQVVQPSANQQRYLDLLKQMPSDSAAMHWMMAEQCTKLSLPRERTFHLEETIRHDPNHEKARLALKFKRKEDGSWAKLEEIKAEAGLVRRNGRWVTKSEAELADAADERRHAKLDWQKKLRLWRNWLKHPKRRQKALDAISSIEDPLAAEALIKMFWSENNIALRELLAEVLGRLPSGRAATALAKAAMLGDSEAENDIRLHAIRQLDKNNRRSVASRFVSALRSNDNVQVRRAGHALGVLGDDAVVLPLIKSLRTKHTRLISGPGNGGINMRNGGLSVGRSKPKKVSEFRNNKEVLSALVKITRQDFGYDQRKWLNWYLSRSTPPKLDLRRDP